jgi:type VI secretion system protein ImpM
VSALVPGLFGKLPAHGDFVRRGWDDATVASLDAWIGDGLTCLRARAADNDDAYPSLLRAAPLWRFFLPPGWCGARAVVGALAASVDRVGRYFVLVVGCATDVAADAWVAARAVAELAERAIGAALGAGADAEVVLAIVECAGIVDAEARLLAAAAMPGEALFWTMATQPEPLMLRARRADVAAFTALFGGA